MVHLVFKKGTIGNLLFELRMGEPPGEFEAVILELREQNEAFRKNFETVLDSFFFFSRIVSVLW